MPFVIRKQNKHARGLVLAWARVRSEPDESLHATPRGKTGRHRRRAEFSSAGKPKSPGPFANR